MPEAISKPAIEVPAGTAAERRRANLRRLLRPRHIAFVGGRSVAGAIRQCIDSGFPGPIWPVSLKEETLAGLRCHASIADLPEAPDATFIAVPRGPTIEIVRTLSARGAGGAVCYAAGFAEVGEEGAGLQRLLVEAAGDLALLGPNCYGLLNYIDGVPLWPVGHSGERIERGVAMIGQSGNIALNLTSNQRSVPFAYVVSLGNQAILTAADLVDALVEDERVSAIGIYLEGLTDVPAFARAAARALESEKPIVALKAGRSDLGSRLAMSHTSSLAGDDRLYDALFDRLGIIRMGSLSGFLETLKLIAVAGVPRGNRLVTFTCSGGDGLMAADLAAEQGLALPEFSPAQFAALRAQLPDFASVTNPLDYNTSLWGNRAELTRCFATALSGESDLGLLLIDYPERDPFGRRDCDISVDAMIDAGAAAGRPVVVASTIAELLPEPARERMIGRGAAPLQGLEDTFAALGAAVRHGTRRRQIREQNETLDLPPAGPVRGEPRLLDEAEAKRLLAGYGLVVPASRLATAAEAPLAAASLGFPVVAKVARPALAHKTEAGAVTLDLRSAPEVAACVETMSAALARHRPGAAAERFLVERQVTGAVAEMIVGVRRDPQFGLVLVLGAGGVLVEMVRDVATLLLPTSRSAVERALSGLKVARLLDGWRGRPAGDRAAIVEAVLAIAAFAEAHRDRLVELDVNPLLVLPAGAVAVDALLVMGEP